jgi:hypothetical protein
MKIELFLYFNGFSILKTIILRFTYYNKNPMEMKSKFFVWLILTGGVLIVSCNNTDNSAGKRMVADNHVLQQNDGTISLKIDKAACYQDVLNPSTNTAEWSMLVSKAGRYDVWLSSATKDTTDLKYKNAVLLNIRDKRLEIKPTVNKVVKQSSDVSRPYFQAESFMGSLYIQDTGVYNVQVISDRILPEGNKGATASAGEIVKIVSVSLKPARK